MHADVRQAIVERLTAELGATIDTSGIGDGWVAAHTGLRAVEWVLDSAGLGPDDVRVKAAWEALARPSTADALAEAHRRREWLWYNIDVEGDDDDWPLPIGDYAGLIETVLDTDFAALPVETWRPAAARFAVPDDDVVIGCVNTLTDFELADPTTWRIQRRIGPADIHDRDLDAEIDRFISHWSFERNSAGSWLEINRGQAIQRLVACQRTSLLSSRTPWGDPGEKVARDRADCFLYCFPRQTRYFTNSERRDSYRFRITDATLDTGVIAVSTRLAGIWWQLEST